MAKLKLLNERVITFAELPADTHAGPDPINVTANADVHLETTEQSLDAVITVTLVSPGKPDPIPASAAIKLSSEEGGRWVRVPVTGRFTCPAPEFLTVVAECTVAWDDTGGPAKIVNGDVLSRVIPAK